VQSVFFGDGTFQAYLLLVSKTSLARELRVCRNILFCMENVAGVMINCLRNTARRFSERSDVHVSILIGCRVASRKHSPRNIRCVETTLANSADKRTVRVSVRVSFGFLISRWRGSTVLVE
jgi:hypothetical protein